jgi:hypothetical protein
VPLLLLRDEAVSVDRRFAETIPQSAEIDHEGAVPDTESAAMIGSLR